MNFFALTPFVRIALSLLLGVVLGWWGVLFVLLLLLPPFKSFRLYALITLVGAILQGVANYSSASFTHPVPFALWCNPTVAHLPENRGVNATFVVGERVSTYTLCTVLEADSTPYRFAVESVAEINEYTSAQLSVGDTLRCKIYVEGIDDYLIDPKSLLGSLKMRGYNQLIYLYEDEAILRSKFVAKSQSFPFSTASQVRTAILTSIDSLKINSEDKGVLKAMLVGDKEHVSSKTNSRYIKSGVAHTLAISGFHIGVLFTLLNLLFLGWSRIKVLHIIKITTIITTLWFFAFVAQLTPSVVRAVIMFTMFQFALYTTTSSYSGCNILACTFTLMIAMQPAVIYNVGFQLSFMAMGVIVAFAPTLTLLLQSRGRVVRFLLYSALLSLLITLFILPLTLYHFGSGSLLSPITNLLFAFVAPLMYLLTILAILTPLSLFHSLLSLLLDGVEYILNLLLSFNVGYFQNIKFTTFDLLLSYFILSLLVWVANSYLEEQKEDENVAIQQ